MKKTNKKNKAMKKKTDKYDSLNDGIYEFNLVRWIIVLVGLFFLAIFFLIGLFYGN